MSTKKKFDVSRLAVTTGGALPRQMLVV